MEEVKVKIQALTDLRLFLCEVDLVHELLYVHVYLISVLENFTSQTFDLLVYSTELICHLSLLLENFIFLFLLGFFVDFRLILCS